MMAGNDNLFVTGPKTFSDWVLVWVLSIVVGAILYTSTVIWFFLYLFGVEPYRTEWVKEFQKPQKAVSAKEEKTP